MKKLQGKRDTTESRRDLAAQAARPLRNYLATETGSAGLLLAAALIALVWVNSPFSDSYDSFWDTVFAINLGDWSISMDLRHWIDEGLMALFFFVIGLEVRRELSVGELTDRHRVTIPVIAGIGGMLLPALLYTLLNHGSDAAGGWGIVIATDTAFLLGALAIVGPHLSTQLRIFLLTLAIVDDIVAISVIGIFYSDSLNFVALGISALCLAMFPLFPRMRIYQGWAYLLLGLALWLSAYESGLHPTLAGMLAGLLVIAYQPSRKKVEMAATSARAFRQSPLPEVARSAQRSVDRAVSPNERLQTALHPLTSYLIVPVFALANAGVDLGDGVLGDALTSPLTWGVVLGLVAGKTIGITVGALGSLRLGLGELPQGVGRGQVMGGAALSGIGFTVSLLIAQLAFDDEKLQAEAKVGVLIAAVLAVGLSWIIFKIAAVFFGQTSATLPRKLSLPVDPERDHIRGREDAPLTLVEYGDFECEFCGRATGMVKELRADLGDELRYVFRHLTLIDVHPHAELAAEAAEAAGNQDKFWEMHDILFSHQGDLDIEDLIGYAGQLSLDVDRFVEEVEQSLNARRIQTDVASADASGAHGTPTFFIGGMRHVGPYDAKTLADELRAAHSDVPID
ncbi:MAG TPA: Na+/H+ antiporter NhaA [Solirubrobacterales bacterium]|nr:Na+/H+ antiporter NhaA [Solirubrobacterales bacterium]